MKDLTRFVQRAPQLLYGSALILFILSVAMLHLQMGEMRTLSATSGSQNRLMLVSGYLQAAQSAIHIAAYGFIADILLAIWRNGRPLHGRGADE